MLTVGTILSSVEDAIGQALPARKAYAMLSGEWPVAAPCMPDDGETAYRRINCGLVAEIKKSGDMLRFALTDAALTEALPALPRDESGAVLLDKLFAGAFPLKSEYEPLALTWARARVLLCNTDAGEPWLAGPSRSLLWLSVRAFQEKSLLAGQKCERAMRKPVLTKAESTLGAVRCGTAALEQVLLRALGPEQ